MRFGSIGLLILLGLMAGARAQDVTEGFVTADDGVQLYYVKAGRGA